MKGIEGMNGLIIIAICIAIGISIVFEPLGPELPFALVHPCELVLTIDVHLSLN